MSDAFDLVVVGAGPGGLAAAATAVESDMRVCLVDDNFACGGQIWRNKVGEASPKGPAALWALRFAGRVEIRSGWRAMSAPLPLQLRIERDNEICDLHFTSLIIATGARELFLPFPGWTLPGVFGVGGLQAFVKSGLDISGKRVVVAGTGPLLPAVAAGLHKAGAQIVAVVEQATMARLARFGSTLLFTHPAKLIEGTGYAWTLAGTPYWTGAWVTEASGDGRLQRIRVAIGQDVRELETDMLAIGFHLVPNVELAQMFDCELDGGFVKVNSLQKTSVKGIYCAGELTGVGGMEKAQIEGRIAALTAAGRTQDAKSLGAARHRQQRFAERLSASFELRDELRTLAVDSTIVCRCEDVSHGDLRKRHAWREAKLHTRCGMGPCQGRICGPATQFLYGWAAPLPRPPIFPALVSTLSASLDQSADQQPTPTP